jgi:hypothetical protein
MPPPKVRSQLYHTKSNPASATPPGPRVDVPLAPAQSAGDSLAPGYLLKFAALRGIVPKKWGFRSAEPLNVSILLRRHEL